MTHREFGATAAFVLRPRCRLFHALLPAREFEVAQHFGRRVIIGVRAAAASRGGESVLAPGTLATRRLSQVRDQAHRGLYSLRLRPFIR